MPFSSKRLSASGVDQTIEPFESTANVTLPALSNSSLEVVSCFDRLICVLMRAQSSGMRIGF